MTVSCAPDGRDVSRETTERLRIYADLLQKWTRKINLIAPADVSFLWERHILDCLQLVPLMPPQARSWLDMGSGAGLPGLVVAIAAHESHPELHVTLAESDQRKCAFLREAARATATEVAILNRRIEDLDKGPFDVISARALAPLTQLFDLAHPHAHQGTCFLFPKGRQAATELTQVGVRWHSCVDQVPSRVQPESTILKITELEPAT